MLILSRKRGESIMIGDDVEVRVVDIGDGKVRLGVTGPASVPVHQRERLDSALEERDSHVACQPERLPVAST